MALRIVHGRSGSLAFEVETHKLLPEQCMKHYGVGSLEEGSTLQEDVDGQGRSGAQFNALLLYVHRDLKDYCFTSTETLRTTALRPQRPIALRPQRPQGLLLYVHRDLKDNCFTSTETYCFTSTEAYCFTSTETLRTTA